MDIRNNNNSNVTAANFGDNNRIASDNVKTVAEVNNNENSAHVSVSTLISHNININGHRTSVRLEKEMWMGLKDIARREKCHVHDLCSKVALRKRKDTSLTAAIRVFIMAYYQAAATDEGHIRAGHGLGPSSAVSVMGDLNAKPYYGLRQFKSF